MKFSAGNYSCDYDLQIIKRLDTNVVKSDDGKKVEKVYGSWATEDDNFIRFSPNKPVTLSEEEVNMPHIAQLVERGILKRVF